MENEQHQQHSQKLFRRIIDMPIPVYIILATGCFLILLIIMFLSMTRNGSMKLAVEKWILIGAFAVMVEIVNQFTYQYAKKNRIVSKVLKTTIFWSIFYACAGTYTVMLYQLPVIRTFDWTTQVGPLLALFLLSLILPFYSASTDIRFLLLYGTYK